MGYEKNVIYPKEVRKRGAEQQMGNPKPAIGLGTWHGGVALAWHAQSHVFSPQHHKKGRMNCHVNNCTYCPPISSVCIFYRPRCLLRGWGTRINRKWA